jgi:hypothetical protein
MNSTYSLVCLSACEVIAGLVSKVVAGLFSEVCDQLFSFRSVVSIIMWGVSFCQLKGCGLFRGSL